MTQPKITMYVKPNCSDVDLARAILKARGRQWEEIDIEQDPDALAEVKAWNDGRAVTPTLWIGDTMLSEPDAAEILAALGE